MFYLITMFCLADVPIVFDVISLVSMASTDLGCHGVAVAVSLVECSSLDFGRWLASTDKAPTIS